jgi:hypothetical protein
VKYIDNVNITKLCSEKKRTIFAPEWFYIFANSFVKNVDFKKLEKFLLKKEKQIMKLPNTIREGRVSDGNTGLGKNSTTARFDQYNILSWNNDEIKKLKQSIIEMHDKFLEQLNISKPNELFTQCWVNIMRKGEQIKPHIHSALPDCYLGGHICVKCEDTSTYYINSINQISQPQTYAVKNEVGKITLFQNYIPHYTDIHNGNEERITIAFDLVLRKKFKNYIQLY